MFFVGAGFHAKPDDASILIFKGAPYPRPSRVPVNRNHRLGYAVPFFVLKPVLKNATVRGSTAGAKFMQLQKGVCLRHAKTEKASHFSRQNSLRKILHRSTLVDMNNVRRHLHIQ